MVRMRTAQAATLAHGGVGVNRGLQHDPEAAQGGGKRSGIATEGGARILEPGERAKRISVQ